MENIVRTIRVYYPVSDEALATLAHGFEKQVFPVKTLIIRAGQFDRQVHFIEKGMTRSYTLHDGKEINYKKDMGLVGDVFKADDL